MICVIRIITEFISLFRPNLAGGTTYPTTPRSMQALTYDTSVGEQKNPRIILISSRVPAAEVILLFYPKIQLTHNSISIKILLLLHF